MSFLLVGYNWEIYEHMLIMLFYNLTLCFIFLYFGYYRRTILVFLVFSIYFVSMLNLIVARNIVFFFYNAFVFTYFSIYILIPTRYFVIILLIPVFCYIYLKVHFILLSFFYFFLLVRFIFTIINFNSLARLNIYVNYYFFWFFLLVI